MDDSERREGNSHVLDTLSGVWYWRASKVVTVWDGCLNEEKGGREICPLYVTVSFSLTFVKGIRTA